jgi:hypothetical protein
MSRCIVNVLFLLIAGRALAAPDLALSELSMIDLSDRSCAHRAALRVANDGTDTSWGMTVFAGDSPTLAPVLTQITEPIRPNETLLLVLCRPSRRDGSFCVSVQPLHLADSDRKEQRRSINRLCWPSEPPGPLAPSVQIAPGEQP